MSFYLQKKRLKFFLIFSALLIVGASLWYTDILVKKIASEERKKAGLWANAIEKKASLMKYTNDLFGKMQLDERKKVELWASAYNKLLSESNTTDLTFYINIISSNKTIPTILTDKDNHVISFINLDNKDSILISAQQNYILEDSMKVEFTKYPPIVVSYGGRTLNYIYYKDSKLFSELQTVMNDLIKSFMSEIVLNSASVPVIITDSIGKKVIAYGNIDSLQISKASFVREKLDYMASQNKPIEVKLGDNESCHIYYEDSYLLRQLRYYPFIQFSIIGLFLILAYLGFSNARKAEQNQVWIGMARETAHQLGTPLSSLIAWVEYLRLKEFDENTVMEIQKDVEKLEIITERFSKIGSEPELKKENIGFLLSQSIDYFKFRSSKKIVFSLSLPNEEVSAPVNTNLFNWVIENLFKNAIDAMQGEGSIDVKVAIDKKNILIDITDSGKGLHKSKFKTIFKPGFTTKKRGWGLGLSLSKRIIEDYHRGKIFVKQSVIDEGTTFRIVLKLGDKIS